MSRLRLTPLLPRSVGFLPVLSPPERCLRHRSIHAQPVPVDALQFIKLLDTGVPELQEDACLDPLLEAVMSGGFGTQVGLVEGLPLAASAKNVEDGIGTASIGDTRSSSAKAVRVEAYRNERLKHGPQSIGDAEAGRRWIVASALS